MSEAAEHSTRGSQSANSRQYDRIARFYSTLEPLYLIFPPARRKAVAALGLKPGDTVLEIGAGADVMKRIATPMIGGVVTSTIMELAVYPAIFFLWRARSLKAAPSA